MLNQSEKMFVEWAKVISPEANDVKAVVSELRKCEGRPLRGLDVGGGIGKFALEVCNVLPNVEIDVVDKSSLARSNFVDSEKVSLVASDFFDYRPPVKYDFVILKTVLHHFIDHGEEATRRLQLKGLVKARECLANGGRVFIEENFYESYVGDTTGRLIHTLTSLKSIAGLTRRLGANTAGEGVRFRSFHSWGTLFSESGLAVTNVLYAQDWLTPLWQRIPLLCRKRFQAVLVLGNADDRPAGP